MKKVSEIKKWEAKKEPASLIEQHGFALEQCFSGQLAFAG